MKYFGQTTSLSDSVYADAQALREAAKRGIDDAMAKDQLGIIVTPGYTSHAAVSGYPSLALPVGLTPAGSPVSMLMYSRYLREDMIFACAYDLEQELAPRRRSSI